MASTSTVSGSAQAWSGVFPYIPTPLDHAGRLAPDRVVALVERLLSGGVSGITPLGSSGEAPLLGDSIKAQLVDTVVQAVGGRVPVVPGICGFGTDDCVRQAKRVQRQGGDGILLILLSYFPLSADEILSAASAVVDAVDLPVVLYHHPELCGITLDDDTVRRLHRDCGIGYLKDASGNVGNISRWRDIAGPTLQMFAATAVPPAAAMASGACGLMSGPATVFPEQSVRLVEHAARRESHAALQAEAVLRPALELFRRLGPARAVKALLVADGQDCGQPVPPLAPLRPGELASAAECVTRVRRGATTS